MAEIAEAAEEAPAIHGGARARTRTERGGGRDARRGRRSPTTLDAAR